MEILFSDEFREDYRKIKDVQTRIRLIKQIKKLEQDPQAGKPLSHQLKGYRTLRVAPYRIIYRIEQDKIIINCFEHRENVYKK
jgi:addiction module RelE/StbE family toxin